MTQCDICGAEATQHIRGIVEEFDICDDCARIMRRGTFARKEEEQ